MKALAAHRAGLKTIVLPKRNQKDLDELPKEVLDDVDIVMVDQIDEAIAAAFAGQEVSEAVDADVNLASTSVGDGCDVDLITVV